MRHDYDNFSDYLLDVASRVKSTGGKPELLDRDEVEEEYIKGTSIVEASNKLMRTKKRPK